MISKEEYIEYLKNLVKEDVEGKEYLSKEYIDSCNSKIKAGIILIAISFIFLVFGIPLFIIGAVLLILGTSKKSKTTAIEKEIAGKYTDKIIDHLLKDYKHVYDKKKYIDEQIFNQSKFTYRTRYDKYTGEDYLSINIPNNNGSESNCNLILSDIYASYIEVTRDSDGNRHQREVTLYDSVFGYVKFPFKFECTLTINANSFIKSGLKRIELEDIIFNRKFTVLSTDQIEARRILTPTMMQKLMNLKKRLGEISLVMVDDMMYVGAKYRKLFQLKGAKNGPVYEMFSNIYDDVKLILDVVKEIKDNDKIFKM